MFKDRKKLPFVLGIFILVVAFLSFFLYKKFSPKPKNNFEGISVRSIPPSNAIKLSPDEVVQGRLLRGVLTAYFPDQDSVEIDAYLDWPKKENHQKITLALKDNTQFLCWPTTITTTTGTTSQVAEALFLLGDDKKLSLNHETYFHRDQLKKLSLANHDVAIALQTTYQNKSTNNVFQLAVIGCQDEK